MSLLDEARAQSRRPGPPCSVQKAMGTLPDLADDIAEVIRAHDISQSAAGRAFIARGLNIAGDTVRRHRVGECTYCRDLGVSW